jgi:hypothetical protein
MTARRLFLLAFAAALLTGFGCSNDSGSGSSSPALLCSDAGNAAANGVTTRCGAAIDSQTERVDVVMGGPAAGATTLRGLNLDVTFDPARLQFTTASATSPLFPAGLVAANLSGPGRVVVSVQQTGGNPDVSVAPGQHVVLSLTFQRASGASFGATPLPLENTEATAASATITFTSGVSLAFQ